jgi:molybdate transport system substrate-binding protein
MSEQAGRSSCLLPLPFRTRGGSSLAVLLSVVPFLLAPLLLSSCGGKKPVAPPEIVVSAATSLRGPIETAVREWKPDPAIRVALNFGASTVLARQIRDGGGIDLFLSADEEAMTPLFEKGVVRRPALFLSNRLVLAARADSKVAISRPEELASQGHLRIVVGDPATVPVGRYARSAFRKIVVGDRDLWSQLESRLVPAVDARGALALVEADPTLVGVLFRTDALASKKVRLLAELPAGDPPEIRYLAAVVASRSNEAEAARFLKFLEGPEGKAIFLRSGFVVPSDEEKGRWAAKR